MNRLLLCWFSVLGMVGMAEAQGQSQTVDLNADANYSNADWRPVLDAIGDKTIVLLGEFTHGAKEIFTTRNELIRALHDQKGFDVILFESGIGEMAAVDVMPDSVDAVQMTRGFFGGWRTPEFQQLMQYAKVQGIEVAGFDVQRTGGVAKPFLVQYARQTGHSDASFELLEDKFGVIDKQLKDRKTDYDSVKRETHELISDYQRLIEAIIIDDPDQTTLLVKRTLENRIDYLSYRLRFVKDNDWTVRWNARDSIMAANVSWHLENIYVDKKVIIIGHNFHIGKANEKLEVMGELLLPKYQSRMYSIGVFAGGGSYLDNYGRPKEMIAPDTSSLDIKTIIHGLGGTLNFVDINSFSSGPRWIDWEIIVNDSFIDLHGSNTMILGNCFDGLLLLDRVSPPELQY